MLPRLIKLTVVVYLMVKLVHLLEITGYAQFLKEVRTSVRTIAPADHPPIIINGYQGAMQCLRVIPIALVLLE